MSIKQEALNEKIEKKRRLALHFIKSQGGINKYFHYVTNKPTEEQFLDMVTVAFYGADITDKNILEPIAAGGDYFFVEYFLDALKRVNNNYKNGHTINNISLTEEGVSEVLVFATQTELWLNMGSLFIVDRNIIDYIEKLKPFDFERLDNYFFVDKETRSLALRVIITRPQVETNKLFSWFDNEDKYNLSQTLKAEWMDSPFKRDGFATEYIVLFTTLDRVNKFEEYEREKHRVRGHERHLQDGKIIDIRSHARRNPLKSLKAALSTEEVDYLVYRAKDADGIIRYYGEGVESRPSHVNSGVSHNYKINEHFFLRGKMRVEIVKTHLSKQEALIIEKMLIRNHTISDLWNIKDYEPLGGGIPTETC